jgi:hypothetical protein
MCKVIHTLGYVQNITYFVRIEHSARAPRCPGYFTYIYIYIYIIVCLVQNLTPLQILLWALFSRRPVNMCFINKARLVRVKNPKQIPPPPHHHLLHLRVSFLQTFLQIPRLPDGAAGSRPPSWQQE